MKVVVTGGAGFIGSALIRYLIQKTDSQVLNLDKLSYAGNLNSLGDIQESSRYTFVQSDIVNRDATARIFADWQPDAVMHLAAESHVDRSIEGPDSFIQTNLVGTFNLLEAARHYWSALPAERRRSFRFLNISTDEVYGDLEADDPAFTEQTAYNPSSPYAASKAGADHLVRAWGRTYGLPVLITNCSNNYGPHQFPEKLIPHMILNALSGQPLPVYGDGQQIRDWLYVEDHVRALHLVLTEGELGQTFNIGGFNEKKNLDVVNRICSLLDQHAPDKPPGVNRFADLITFVNDRPGHDTRYAVNANKIASELNWTPNENFDSGMEKTVRWYLDNRRWCNEVLDGSYRLTRIGESAGV